MFTLYYTLLALAPILLGMGAMLITALVMALIAPSTSPEEDAGHEVWAIQGPALGAIKLTTTIKVDCLPRPLGMGSILSVRPIMRSRLHVTTSLLSKTMPTTMWDMYAG